MNRLLTTKQVARALDVSESSVKRWCDKGVIAAQYTAGGHRRIALPDVLAFVKRSKCELVQPDALGLPSRVGHAKSSLHRAQEAMVEALLAGRLGACQQIVIDLFLSEHRVATICDAVLAASFHEIGERWACGEAEIFQERLACEIVLNTLHGLENLLPSPPDAAPLALGAAPEGDQYSLGTAMAALVLRDNRWRATSLGDNLPIATLRAAILRHRPKLFWLSCSHLADEDRFASEYNALFEEFSGQVAFVLGGRALHPGLRKRLHYSAFCDSMQHLEDFANTLRAGDQEGSPS
ncbi:MAG: helix-turn-helix domain-containing protein [Planctomycetota bacterium]|nr:MAG: helix-turn-helix domain-containing protein [Planctomycetota bacterium]